MRLSLLPALLLAAAAVVPAAAAEESMPSACAASCAACLRDLPRQAGTQAETAARPWYVGPKGGDIRKGHVPAPDEGMATLHGSDAVSTEKPWFIGPKGGDTRKGRTPAMDGAAVEIAPAAKACSHHQAPAVGPKGGLLKDKGRSDADVLARAAAACRLACSR